MKNKDEELKGAGAVLLTALLWSLGGLLIKLVPWSPLSINSARCLIALLIKTAMRRNVKVKLTARTILGALCFFATTVLFVYSNKLTTAANAIVLQYSSPIFIMLASAVYFKKKPRGVEVLSSLVIIVGIALCFFDSISAGGTLGNVLAVVSGLTFGLMFFINSLPGSEPADANYLGFFFGAVAGLPFIARETDFSATPVVCVFILGAVQICLAYTLFEYGIKRISALTANLITAIEPVASPIWVALFYGETIGAKAIVGGALVIAAALFQSIASSKRRAQKEIANAAQSDPIDARG